MSVGIPWVSAHKRESLGVWVYHERLDWGNRAQSMDERQQRRGIRTTVAFSVGWLSTSFFAWISILSGILFFSHLAEHHSVCFSL